MNLLAVIFLFVGAAMCGCGWLAWRRAGEARRLALRFERNAELPALPDAPRAADWTVADRDMMASLLASEFGRKLINRLQATEYVLAVTNAQDKANTVHAAGVTSGYNQCLRHLLSLSQSACAVAEKPNDSGASQGEAQPIEREVEEYAARMSP